MSPIRELLAIGLREFPCPPSPDRGLGIWAAPGASEVTLAVLPASGRRTPSQSPAWFSPDFFVEPSVRDSAGPWLPALQVQSIPRRQLEELLRSRAPSRPHWKWQDRAGARTHFLERTEEVLRRIGEGTLTKAVPIAFLEGPPTSPSSDDLAWMLLQALRFHEASGGYLYGAWNSDAGILGVTPELLLERVNEPDGVKVRTMALAGTRALEKGQESKAEALLLEDPKERHEHALVVEGITQRLAGLGHLDVGRTGTRRAGALVHLETSIGVTLEKPNELALGREHELALGREHELALGREHGPAPRQHVIAWQELVDRLHPTPALGAHPREAGARWLVEQERETPRSRFGAPFGVRLNGRDVCAVAIRNIEWSGEAGFCRIGAGAGVVSGSAPEREWAEIERKWNSVLGILGLETSS